MRVTKPILVLEDSADDVFLMKYAFKEAGLRQRVVVAEGGRSALEYLTRNGECPEGAPERVPCVIVTDLKMPGMGGFEVMAWLRQRELFNSVPVLVLSASGDEGDRKRAAELGASGYFVKPCGIAELAALVRRMNEEFIEKHCATAQDQQVQWVAA